MTKKTKKNQKKNSKKHEFYHELDHHTKRRHFSCATLVVILVVLLGLGVWGANALITGIFQRINTPQTAVSAKALSQAKEKLSIFLRPLVGKNAQIKTAVPLTLRISSAELNSLLLEQSTVSDKSSALAGVRVDVTPLAIDFYKAIDTPLPINLDAKVSALPEIRDGKLSIKIKETHLGKIKLPPLLSRSLTKAINKPFEQAMNKDNLKYTSASLEDNALILEALAGK